MTAMQERISNRISGISDEGLAIIERFIDSMNPVYFIVRKTESSKNASKRFGIAKDALDPCDDFDKWNDEIANLFEGEGV